MPFYCTSLTFFGYTTRMPLFSRISPGVFNHFVGLALKGLTFRPDDRIYHTKRSFLNILHFLSKSSTQISRVFSCHGNTLYQRESLATSMFYYIDPCFNMTFLIQVWKITLNQTILSTESLWERWKCIRLITLYPWKLPSIIWSNILYDIQVLL